ncbi:exonuclease domain-containing protein [Psychromonas ossibalaenae]|uniref:exonuclease domain-containing protein n=1 Tax=Psychromonas ossibalaenae TaxID=444922 RepID=UPI00037DF18D|nr:exonuclease domain-containing protein [Psychromonas ossibalaenae]
MFKSRLIKSSLHRQFKRSQNADLKAYFQAQIPLINLPVKQTPLLVLDLEMTGLNPNLDQIISIGLLPLIEGKIVLAQAQYKLIKINGSVGQSAAVHGVLDQHLQQAVPLKEALHWFIQQATGKVLAAHHAPLDLSFLQQAINRHLNEKCALFAVDSLDIERRRILRRQGFIKGGELRLGECRERYNLPVYAAHNALTDALACAELLLAQLAADSGINKVKISQLLR